MDRARLEELISGFLDDEIDASERSELDAYLAESPEAEALLASYRSQAESLRRLEQERVPAELTAQLKKRLTPKPRKGGSWWVVGSIAACLAFFWGSFLLQPANSATHYYLAADGLYPSVPTEEHRLVLNPSTSDSHVYLASAPLKGVLRAGSAQLHCLGDGGTVGGQRLRARLSVDLDGDRKYDWVSESEPLALDDKDGYQTFTTSFPVQGSEWVGKSVEGQVQLEIIGDDLGEQGVSLRFVPGQSKLTLPLEGHRV